MIWSHREDLPVGCTIVGDPQHDCINLAKVLHFRASDKENLMEDHAETMHRLAAPDYPVPEHDVSNPPRRNGPGRAYALPVPERQLSKEAVALLWSACIDPWPKWQNVFQHSTEGVIQEAKNFLTLPWAGSPNASEPTCIQLASLSDSKVRRNFERRFGVSCVGTSMAKKARARIETYRGRTMYPNIRRG